MQKQWKRRDPPTSIHIINTTFKNCSAAQGGAIFLRQFAGDARIVIKNSLFVENCSPGGIGGHKSLFSSQGARALNVSAANILLEIYNSSFKGHRVKGEGGVILLKATHSCRVDVSNALFSNTTSTLRGGAISIECRNNGSGETPLHLFT